MKNTGGAVSAAAAADAERANYMFEQQVSQMAQLNREMTLEILKAQIESLAAANNFDIEVVGTPVEGGPVVFKYTPPGGTSQLITFAPQATLAEDGKTEVTTYNQIPLFMPAQR